MVSHAAMIRDLQRRELLVDGEREQLVNQHCPPNPIGLSNLHHRLGHVLRRALTEARSFRVALRVAAQG